MWKIIYLILLNFLSTHKEKPKLLHYIVAFSKNYVGVFGFYVLLSKKKVNCFHTVSLHDENELDFIKYWDECKLPRLNL
jgi:hypothetical protein